jgi:glycosyltransferase involved in cell wall biosynthesis
MRPLICIACSDDHTKHIVMQRELDTFLTNGYAVCIVDQPRRNTKRQTTQGSYTHIRLPTHTFDTVSKLTWPFIRRIHFKDLHRKYWTTLLRLKMGMNANRISRYMVSCQPDIYIAEDLQSLCAAATAQSNLRRPIIYDAHELETEMGQPDDYATAFLRRLESKLISKVRYVITPNEERAAFYLKTYDLQNDPVVIFNCAPRVNIKKNTSLHTKLGLPEDHHIVIYHGSYICDRSLDQLLLSADEFSDNIDLVMIGDQNAYYRDVLVPVYSHMKHKEKVHWLPYIAHSEIQTLVSGADLGVVIYQDINLNNQLCAPLKLYEYIMLEVPILGCDMPSLRSFMRQNTVGISFLDNSAHTIAAAVNRLFELNTHDRAVIQTGLSCAKEQYSWETESVKWLQVLHQSLDA